MDEPEFDIVSAAAAVTDAEQLSPAYRRAFRHVVEDALRTVFDLESDAAAGRVADYFDEDGGPSLFAYHRSPLQVAFDLTREPGQEMTENETGRYVRYLEGPKDGFGLPKPAPPKDQPFERTNFSRQ